ncbi:NYN domain-containing protein [Sulfuriroseicoccus oceanibius]|uniref:NYN domain-containing protein n=1 Tax=Sulfuriroseicoccus oceanibius TaxID=2707525 RepID=A0A6B3L3T6_9BACT|nr:NYN domain-containing protein [Sulfuriroseicoccus oceanibius]QQL43949.1 NYN domain-containing protein [Sulfuriroseicoccus oceanibius]
MFSGIELADVMERRLLLVDGHSAIHAWPEMKSVIRRGGGDATEPARRMLVQALAAIADATEVEVAVVFDGKGGRHEQVDESTTGIRVVFSGGKRSADGMIERVVAKHGAEIAITVASNDRLVLDAAMAGGADAMSIRGLQQWVDSCDRDFRDRYGRYLR